MNVFEETLTDISRKVLEEIQSLDPYDEKRESLLSYYEHIQNVMNQAKEADMKVYRDEDELDLKRQKNVDDKRAADERLEFDKKAHKHDAILDIVKASMGFGGRLIGPVLGVVLGNLGYIDKLTQWVTGIFDNFAGKTNKY